MIGAIIKNNIVERLIVLKESQLEQLAVALDCEIVDAGVHGLQAGDLRTAAGWTRNAGGMQVVLSELHSGMSYETYELQQKKIMQLESDNADVAENAVNEALYILSGEGDDA